MNLRNALLVLCSAAAALVGLSTITSAHPPHLFTAEEYAFTAKGKTEVMEHMITTGPGILSCPETSLSSAAKMAAVEELEMTAFYGNKTCKFLTAANVAVVMNNCKYIFRPLIEPNVGTHQGTMKIACPAGSEIEYEAAKCLIKIPSQLRELVTFVNEGVGKNRTLKFEFNLKNLEYSTSATCEGGAGKFANGKYQGMSRVEGFNGATEQRGLWIE